MKWYQELFEDVVVPNDVDQPTFVDHYKTIPLQLDSDDGDPHEYETPPHENNSNDEQINHQQQFTVPRKYYFLIFFIEIIILSLNNSFTKLFNFWD